jgi:manganese/zinc/iron transport system substrate-binding protein
MKKILFLISTIILFSCKEVKKENSKLNVVTTTTMLTDLVKNIGGNNIEINGLMGSGVDPHLYKASAGDVTKLTNADIVFYNGLHLEGKLEEIFEKMKSKSTYAVGQCLDKKELIASENFKSNYDPHIWFSISHWKKIAEFVKNKLVEHDTKNKENYEKNFEIYIKKINTLNENIITTINSLPKEKRILVTAHDAFNYFGKDFNFNVVGLQGLSTTTEAGVKDVQKLAAFIIDNQVKAVFVESSVPKRTIEALKESVKAKGHQVEIGGTLFSDALGSANTPEGTYIGMYKHNVNTIVKALL